MASDRLPIKEVSISGVQLLLMQVVEYYLHTREKNPNVRITQALKTADISADKNQNHKHKQPASTSNTSHDVNGDELSHDKLIPDAQDRELKYDDAKLRLEAIGYDIGQRLVELISVDKDRFDNELDTVKFVCKDFWETAFGKQIDLLKTNRRGLYVLQDSNFKYTCNVSVNDGQESRTIEEFTVFPCGLVCGALHRLGMKCRVTA
eukprot:CAMPEP_0184698188 /NCGR_PEP_ID=MMETSP0313-20130426/4900_1 /TAXON_ID=2792 /ORGANISM="Porphyridium aerugineum, Strain SAG 1380-2" /LENGTH=205 /DNA_ID=CAMNT_0027157095 /DNA_START=206 /DNA_END=819 /DNA_ORIENTATION=+